MGAWLTRFLAEPESFQWDDGNRLKLAKHRGSEAETESLFRHPYVFAGRVVEPAHDEPRWLVLGRSESGRRWTLIFTKRGERIRPISCRPMRRDERRIYETSVGTEEE